MLIRLEGTTFCVTGNFERFQNTRTVERALMEGGGAVTKSMAKKTEVLVWGSGWTLKTDTAQQRGLPILREPELVTLLKDGEVEIEHGDAPAEIVPTTELFGELRGTLAEPPSPPVWGALVEHIDQCHPDQLEVLVNYLSEHLGRWTPAEQRCCYAPRPWLIQMINGEDSPAYRLLRVLWLEEDDYNATTLARVFQLPSLTGLRYIDLSVRRKPARKAFKTLSAMPWASQVEHLSLGGFDGASVKALESGGRLTGLVSLGLYPGEYYEVNNHALFRSEVTAQVKTLTLHARNSFGTSNLLDMSAPEALPSFEHLIFDHLNIAHGARIWMEDKFVEWALDALGASERIKALTFRLGDQGYSDGLTLDLVALERLERLELELQTSAPERLDEQLTTLFARPRLPASLRRLTINAPADAPQLVAFRDAHPNVTVAAR